MTLEETPNLELLELYAEVVTRKGSDDEEALEIREEIYMRMEVEGV